MAFKIKETILGVSIAILFVLFVVYGIKVFYDEPEREDFCAKGLLIDSTYEYYRDESYPIRLKEPNVDSCASSIAEFDQFRKSCAEQDQSVIFEYDDEGCQVAKECTPCSKNFKDAMDIYNRNVFIVTGIIGILVVILGAVLHLASVSSGLFGGGVLTIIFGTTNYWSELADWARFIILGVALGVLIYLGYNKFNKK